MKEVQAGLILKIAARVEGVEIDAIIEDDRQRAAYLPSGSGREDRSPEIGRSAERSGSRIKTEILGARLVNGRCWRFAADLKWLLEESPGGVPAVWIQNRVLFGLHSVDDIRKAFEQEEAKLKGPAP